MARLRRYRDTIQNKIDKKLISSRHGTEPELLFCDTLSCEADQVAAKIKELMAKGFENLTDADKTAMRDYFTSQLEEISAILTPEQQQKLKDMRPQGRGPRPDAKPEPAK